MNFKSQLIWENSICSLQFIEIHKGLSPVPGRPVTSDCGMPTKKYLNLWIFVYSLKCKASGHISGTQVTFNKIKSINNVANKSILAGTDAVGLYPTIPHESGLNAIKKHLTIEKRSLFLLKIYLKCFEFV